MKIGKYFGSFVGFVLFTAVSSMFTLAIQEKMIDKAVSDKLSEKEEGK